MKKPKNEPGALESFKKPIAAHPVLRRLCPGLMILILPLLGTGCWSRVEIEQRAFVLAVGIDWLPDKQMWQTTLQVGKPGILGAKPGGAGGGGGGAGAGGGGGGPGNAIYIDTNMGRTLADANCQIMTHMSRQLFCGHLRVIVVGEEAAKKGLGQTLDLYARRYDIHETLDIFVARGTAKEILQHNIPLETASFQAMAGLVNVAPAHSRSIKITLHQVLSDLLSLGTKESFIPRLELKAAEESSGATSQGGSSGGTGAGGGGGAAGGGAGGPGKELQLSGLAVLKKDKFAGWLESRESRGILFANGKARNTMINVKDPKDENYFVVIESERVRSRIVPKLEGNRPVVNLEIKIDGAIISQTSPENLTDPESIRSLERRMATAIKNDVLAALKKIQMDYNSDILGFGRRFHQKYPKLWRELRPRWDEVFPSLEVRVNVTAKIRRTGLRSRGVY